MATPSPIQSENSPSGGGRRSSMVVPSLSDRSLPYPLIFGTADQEQINASNETFAATKSPDSITNLDAQSKSIDDSGAENKPVWIKPLQNGVIGDVMEADSWPELSKSSLCNSSKTFDSTMKGVPNGVLHVLQGTSNGSSSPPKEATPIVSTPNHVGPTSQKYVKPGGSSSGHEGSSTQAPNGAASSPSNPIKSGGPVGGSNGGNDPRRNNSRRTNGGPQQGYNRNFGGRENHAPPHPRPGIGPFIPGPPPYANYVPTPPPLVQMIPYFNHMGYPEVPPMMYYMPGPYQDMPMAMAPQMFFAVDVELHDKIRKQIEFYFSPDNLAKDSFMRQRMDNEGWVPLNLIAGFGKVAELTNNIHLIHHVLQASEIIEIKGYEVRRKDDWKKWILRLHENATT